MKKEAKKSLAKKLVVKEKKRIQRKTHKVLLKLCGKSLLALCLLGLGFFLGVHRRVILAKLKGEEPPEAPEGHCCHNK